MNRTTPSPLARPSIMVRLTVPRFSGPAAFAVKLVLGLSDIAALFERGRVGAVTRDDLHESFDVELEPDTGVGGNTSAGPIELLNDGGMLRLTVPGLWRGVLNNYAERTESLTIDGKGVARGWFTPKPGASVEIPIPIGSGQRRLSIGIAP
jgi:hypothetical protein